LFTKKKEGGNAVEFHGGGKEGRALAASGKRQVSAAKRWTSGSPVEGRVLFGGSRMAKVAARRGGRSRERIDLEGELIVSHAFGRRETRQRSKGKDFSF